MTKSIMLVDDSVEILQLYGMMFKRRGYQVYECLESTEALKMLESSTPDLFVLDVMMPGINGIELCGMIRALPDHEFTPVIVLSAYSDTRTIEQAFSAGANDYLLKPIDPKLLESKIQELLGITAS